MDQVGLTCINGTIVQTDIHGTATYITIVMLGLIDLAVIVGNSLVVAAVITTRKLRTVTNIFIVSLACADLLLGFAVLPFSISVTVTEIWLWGSVWCNMWLAIDVLLCTASILSLCAISLDRYVAVTRPIRYPSIVSPFRGKILVSFVWILSFVICLPPLLGWNDSSEMPSNLPRGESNYSTVRYMDRITEIPKGVRADYVLNLTTTDYFYDEMFSNLTHISNNDNNCNLNLPTCELTLTSGYRIYASNGSFFIPMFVMVFFYFRIYLAAMKTAASLRKGVLTTKVSSDSNQRNGSSEETLQLRVHRGGSTSSSQYSYQRNNSMRCYRGFQAEGNKSPRPRSATMRSSHTAIKADGTLTDKLIEENHKNNNDNEKSDGRGIVFVKPFGKKWKEYRNRKYTNDDTEMHVLNPKQTNCLNDSLKSGNSTSSGCNQNDTTNVTFKRSPRRCQVLIKETKSSDSAKGHARKFRREAKAAKTLSIIVGAFIVCWFPFFAVYLIGAFCNECISDIVFSVFFWLGYCNSALNPCIYALFARDFRFAFKRLIYCKRRKGFNHAARADYITGTRKVPSYPAHIENDSISDY